jgi:hypothetical protein
LHTSARNNKDILHKNSILYPSLCSCVVLEPLEVFGGFGEGFGIAILGVEIMVTFLPSLPFIQVGLVQLLSSYTNYRL